MESQFGREVGRMGGRGNGEKKNQSREGTILYCPNYQFMNYFSVHSAEQN